MNLFNLRQLISLTIFCLVALTSAVEAQSPSANSANSRMVLVNGHKMHVQTYGLDKQRPEEIPVVIFENGALSPIDSWGEVPAQVASFAPVVTYDRSTIGKSEWDGEIGTPAHVTENLWTLFSKLDVDPPYVLVGWSWGGDLIRYHAGTHPEDVVGLVHVDPAAHSPKALLSIFKAIGYGKEEYTADVEAMENGLPNLPSLAMQADVKPINNIYLNNNEPDFGKVPSVPTAVLLAGKFRQPSAKEIEMLGEVSYDRKAHFEAKLRSKIERTSEWALSSREGLFVIVRNSEHALQLHEPALVEDAIRRMVFPDPSPQLRSTIVQRGSQAFRKAYQELKRYYPAERFSEGLLNSLGYELLAKENIEEAIAVFELNVEEYPETANPYDSLGDAYRAAGELQKARESYTKAVELAPDSDHSQVKLEQVTSQLEQENEEDAGNNN